MLHLIAIATLLFSLPAISKGEIAFMREGCVWVLDVETGAERQIAEAQYDRPVTWSPDGKHLIWWDHRSGGWDLWRCEADGSNAVNLTPETTGGCRSPSYSPDGSRIAFMRDDPAGLWIMNADGSDMQQLSERGHRDTLPQWAPDGMGLLYVDIEEREDGEGSIHRLRLFDLETAGDQALAVGETAQWIDIDRIIFVAHRDESGSAIDVATLNDDGTIASRRSMGPGCHALVSPMRQRVAIAERTMFEGKEMFALRIVGIDDERDSDAPFLETSSFRAFDWSPDGRYLLVATDGVLRIFDVATGASIHEMSGDYAFPAWRPAGLQPGESQ